jgi:hypothetical protein
LLQEDICSVLQHQVERQFRNFPQDQRCAGYFPTSGQHENTGMSQMQQGWMVSERERERNISTRMVEKEKDGLNVEGA